MDTDSAILNTLLEISVDAIIVSDESYRVLRVNPTFNKLTGLDAQEVKGRSLIQHDRGSREKPLLETVEKPYAKGSSWAGLITISKKDGKAFTSSCAIVTINDGQGNPIRHIAVLRPGASPEGHSNDEGSGLILQVGAWVLRRACKQCKDWLDEGLKPIRISINVASHQLRSSDFANQVIAILAETRIPANLLELEITESNMMDNSVACMKVLQTFRDMGIHISIDDFGTGYSSLSYLSRFPITTLKIDRAFVNNLQDSNNAEITRAIISLSHSLKLDVIAEGAEVADQVIFLGIHGCIVVQGFFYSKPVSAEVFEKMLRIGYIHKG